LRSQIERHRVFPRLVIAHGVCQIIGRGFKEPVEGFEGSMDMTIETFLNIGNSRSLRVSSTLR
jgi:hypothetical protein